MKLEELKPERLIINEIFDTNVDIKWLITPVGYRGKFVLYDHEYEIQLDELQVDLDKPYTVIDFGFTRDGKWETANEPKTASKVFGIIFNAFIKKLNEIKSDMVLFGVNYINGSVESRKSLYDRLTSWYCRASRYDPISDWVKTPNGEYRILSCVKLTEKDVEILNNYIKSLANKPQ